MAISKKMFHILLNWISLQRRRTLTTKREWVFFLDCLFELNVFYCFEQLIICHLRLFLYLVVLVFIALNCWQVMRVTVTLSFQEPSQGWLATPPLPEIFPPHLYRLTPELWYLGRGRVRFLLKILNPRCSSRKSLSRRSENSNI